MSKVMFETIPLSADEFETEFESDEIASEFEDSEWAGEEEEENERGGRLLSRGGRARRLVPQLRPIRARRPINAAARAVPSWLVPMDEPVPDSEPFAPPDDGGSMDFADDPPAERVGDEPAEEFGIGRCKPSCRCAGCRDKDTDERESWSSEEEFGEAEFETLELETLELESSGLSSSRAAPAATPCRFGPGPCLPDNIKPTLTLEGFRFDQSALVRPRHTTQLTMLARRILASRRTAKPIRAVVVEGHTDKAGPEGYNVALAKRRATTAGQELCRLLDRMSPGAGRGLDILVSTCGERQALPNAAKSRRVEIFVPTARRTTRRNPPDYACGGGVPRRAGLTQPEFEEEFEQYENTSPPRRRSATVRPRLCLYQVASVSAHTNHFRCQADRFARVITAQASPTATACPSRVGGTPYSTGADIIAAIVAAHRCQKQRLDAVHIFSHAGTWGIFGPIGGSFGLYETTSATDEARGARIVKDIPTSALAQNAVFVIHGCNAGSSGENIARALYRHLAGGLNDPKVFAHPNAGCAGRDNSWREYSKRSPDGRVRLRTLAPLYRENGCC